MSDINSNHTTLLDNDVPIPSVVRTFSRPLNAEVEEGSIIPGKKKYDGTSAMTSVKTPVTPLFKGLMRTKSYKTSVEMMVPLIIEQLTMMAEVTTELKV